MRLTPEQQELVEAYARQWDPLAAIIAKWPGMIRSLRSHGLDDDEIRGVCWHGVCRAAASYDPDRGASFATYALCWARSSVSGRLAVCGGMKRDGITVSGDQTVGENEACVWDDMAWKGHGPDHLAEENDRLEMIRECVNASNRLLLPRQRLVLRLRFGIGGREHSLTEVGKILNVSKERVRQIEMSAMFRIRSELTERCAELV